MVKGIVLTQENIRDYADLFGCHVYVTDSGVPSFIYKDKWGHRVNLTPGDYLVTTSEGFYGGSLNK
jgi:hypothetical protein